MASPTTVVGVPPRLDAPLTGWLHPVAAAQPGAALEFPFGPDVAVYKVAGRMFVFLTPPVAPAAATLKVHPDDSAALRGAHDSVRPGYHMNKRHWVTVDRGGDVADDLAAELVEGSWGLVVAALPTVVRARLLAELDESH